MRKMLKSSVMVAFACLFGTALCGITGHGVEYVTHGSSVPLFGNGHGLGLGKAVNFGSLGLGQGGSSSSSYTGSPLGLNLASRLASLYDSTRGAHLGSGGFNIGNGYLGYSNYHKSPPVVYDATPWKPIGNFKSSGSTFSVTPSISYGYSYKLVPTYAYGPAPVENQGSGGLGRLGGLYGLLGGLYNGR